MSAETIQAIIAQQLVHLRDASFGATGSALAELTEAMVRSARLWLELDGRVNHGLPPASRER